jgi:twitching motility protein PilT
VELLRRLTARDWKDREELSALIAELGRHRDGVATDFIPLLTANEPTLRAFAELQVRDRLDGKGIEAMLKAVEGKTAHTQSLILHTLLRLAPDPTIPRVARLVTEGDRVLARLAMEALAGLPGHRIGQDFSRFLSHNNAEVRFLALLKVTENPTLLQDPPVRRVLTELGADEDERIRLRILDLLADEAQDPTDAVRICLERLKDPSPAVQQKAVRLLSAALDRLQGSSAADEQLLALLTDGSEVVRNGVIDVLLRRKDRLRLLRKVLLFCKTLVGWVRDRTLTSLRTHAEALGDDIVELMDDADDDVRAMALLLGSTLENRGAVPHIVRLLRDPDWWLRMIAAETLGKIGDPAAVPALIDALQEPESAMVAIEALARIRDGRALVPIARLLNRPEVEIRVEVLGALRAFDDPRVLPLLLRVAEEDPSRAVRDRATRLAERWNQGLAATTGRIRIPDALRLGSAGGALPIQELLIRARAEDASDLHLLVDAPPVFRLHGHLQDVPNSAALTPTAVRELLGPILGEREREVLARHKQVDFCHTIPDVGRYRCNVFEERQGLAAAFRVIPNEVPTLDRIGLPSHLADIVNLHQGLVVVAGPSGSGKSTTLAALVNLFNEQRRSHILLLEDPIEFVHPAKGCLINQREVGRHTRGFAAALRGALREDPDLIVVGQMRDAETVRLAIEASETGHLVIGTMNTTAAPKTVDRIVESFPVAEQQQIRVMLSETLKAVICQQLLPAAEGGGRVALFEVMMATLGVRMLIRDAKTYQIAGQMQIGESKGHVTIDTALGRLLAAGRITPETAWRRAQNRQIFEARLPAEFLAEQHLPLAAT